MFPRLGLAARIAPLVLAGACAVATPAAAFTDAEKAEIGTLVREYLLKNPEVLQEAITVLEQRQDAAMAEARTKALAEVRPVLLNSPRGNVIGNPKGDVTLVGFFDYNCPYCKDEVKDLEQLIKDDPNVRIVIKELPLLGQASVQAAQVAVAVRLVAPEKYWDFYRTLMGMRGRVDREKAFEAAQKVGIDVAQLEKQASSPELNATLNESAMLAQQLSLNGTPSYVVGDIVVSSALHLDQMKAAVAEARKAEKGGAGAPTVKQ